MKVTFQPTGHQITYTSETTAEAFLLGKVASRLKDKSERANNGAMELTVVAEELITLASK